MFNVGGTVTLSNSSLAGNVAIGGAGGKGVSGGDGGAGGLAEGGGLYSIGTIGFSSSGEEFDVPATVTVSNGSFSGNVAQGGAGTAGNGAGSGGAGGEGAGGGAFDDAGSSMSISGTLMTLNSALGGEGGAGGSSGVGGAGGNGFGGGVFNAPNDSFIPSFPGGALSLTDVVVTLNAAIGGSGGRGTTRGDAGQGIGGGLYLADGGTATLTRTHVLINFASTSDPDIFGTTS